MPSQDPNSAFFQCFTFGFKNKTESSINIDIFIIEKLATPSRPLSIVVSPVVLIKEKQERKLHVQKSNLCLFIVFFFFLRLNTFKVHQRSRRNFELTQKMREFGPPHHLKFYQKRILPILPQPGLNQTIKQQQLLNNS